MKENLKMNADMQMGKMSERDMLMWKMQASDFAMEEVGLFLNVHPHDQTALSYFKQYQNMKRQAESDFTKKYGPVTIDNYENDLSTWRWIEDPWPWENGREV